MESELDVARARIIELKADLENERKARKKLEVTNKRLVKELFEERRRREAVERVCEQLAKEIASDKAEINQVKLEMQEERKMLHIAEVLREERVQMKLSEAKILLEEKFLELEVTKQMQIAPSLSIAQAKIQGDGHVQQIITNGDKNLRGETTKKGMTRCGSDVLGDHYKSDRNDIVRWMQPRASGEAENPHIKRGIKGFVEFPKVIRAIGSKSRHLGTKLECQKSQFG